MVHRGHVVPAETITLCGGEYVVSSASSEPVPGYVALEPAESRMVVRGWVWQRDAATLAELVRALGSWRTPRPLDEVESFTQLVETRLDDHVPALVLHRREAPVLAPAVATSGEGVIALAELASRSMEPEERLDAWIEIRLEDRDGKPVPRARYEVRLSNRELRQGYLDLQGFARLEGLPEGNCEVCFPDYDPSMWSHA